MENNNGLQVGYCRVDITPDVPVGLGGYDNANKRVYTSIRDHIFATCIAFREGNETALIFTVDNCAISAGNAEILRPPVAEATGVAENHIFFGATHCHNGPSHGETVIGGVAAAQKRLDGLIEAAKTAIADLSPAVPYAGCTNPKNMNYVRHYTLADGTVTDGPWKHPVETRVGHPSQSNTNMVLLKFAREGKKDILLVNWHAHPDHSGALDPEKTRDENFFALSADFPGAFCSKILAETDLAVAYFTGSSGNQNPHSFIPAEENGLSMQAYGEKLAEIALSALPTLEKIEGSGINAKQEIFAVDVNHTKDHLVEQAKEVYAYYQETDLATSRPLANSYGFQSAYEARAVISRSEMEPTIEMSTGVLRVGGIGFVWATYEMFSDAGIYIKENSPYKATFIMTGNNGYIPSRYAYDFGAYEAVTGFYAPGTAEKLAEHYVDMLKEIK